MKSKLAVFDFDCTVRDNDPDLNWQMGVGHHFPGGELPKELLEICQKFGHSAFRQQLITEVNKLGLTKKQLEDGFAYKNGFLIDKMDEVIKILHQDHDMIMITGTSRNYTDSFLKRFGIFECFEKIYARPSTITEKGTWEMGEYDQSEWGAPCEPCFSTFCKKTVMELFTRGKNYEEIKYFGDGGNDLCPTLSLSEKDKVFPSKNFVLLQLISNEDHSIKANIFPWKDGTEILKNL